MTAEDIGRFIEGQTTGPGGDERFRWGDPRVEPTGVLVTWMATVAAIERAVAEGCNLIICHEELTYPYEFRGGTLQHLPWTVNRLRLGALGRHGITVYRAHGMLDRICIFDDFAEALGLPAPVIKDGYHSIYEVPRLAVRDLAAQVKERLGLDQVRVSGDLDKQVSRLGLPWGGLGLSLNVAFIETVISRGADGLIAGEMDDYAMRYVIDAGVPMVETGHAVSENIGLEHFAQMLREEFPELKVVFFEVDRGWENV